MSAGALDGRVAVITGGSRGIGLGIATAYRAAGAHVVIAARKAAGLAEAREELLRVKGDGDVHTVWPTPANPSRLRPASTRPWPASAGSTSSSTTRRPTRTTAIYSTWTCARGETVRVNQYGMIAWTRCAWRAWMAEHGERRPHIARVGGLIVDPHIGYYNATKAAMLHMTRQLAYELGPRARVNAIAPGLIKTELARAVWEVREPILTAKLPLRRLGTVEDVANAALFLASDASSWMTGQTLVLDGGATALPIGWTSERAAVRRRAVLAPGQDSPSPAPPPGSRFAAVLAQAGATVIAAARRIDRLKGLADSDARIHLVARDVSMPPTVRGWPRPRWPPPAASTYWSTTRPPPARPAEDESLDAFADVLGVNLTAPYHPRPPHRRGARPRRTAGASSTSPPSSAW